ncbi:carbohydrate porin [Acidisphaera sp. L21]|uniref:carbohydrate porin n=1 Tax=Acidisphaera sp. L21 TaxID=1641851 RepID=UPI00131AD49A|nr:carbohydrate porin [Acidisphaera sp. L21]
MAQPLRRSSIAAVVGCFAACLPAIAFAQAGPAPQTIPGASTQQNPTPGHAASTAEQTSPGEPGFTTQLFASSRSNLLGDMWGIRTKLGNIGISLGLSETSELFGNATGGVHRGADYDGLTFMSLGLDTGKAFGWEGGIFNVSAFQIHGRNLATDNLYSLQTNSGIEAQRATRLWEMWYQQSFLGGKVDVKIGQQSLDQEFIGSSYSGLFINTMMGWPLIPSVDLYAGGPAYPLASLGVRFRAQPLSNLTVLAGVFDDNPPGGPFNDDSQVRGGAQSGTAFHTGTGALAIAEVQYAINQPAVGQMDYGTGGGGLPGVYKLGAWYDSGRFPDQRFGTDGLSLADPNSNGVTRMRKNNWSIYGVFDQMVWRPDPDEAQAIGVFARLMGAPGDRNIAEFSINTGVVLKAPLPGRDDDSLGLGYGLAKVSSRAIGLDNDTANFNGGLYPIRSSESFIELTYQAQLAPWLSVQPDFQYVWTPGGGIQNPNNPAKRVGNEAIFGVRTNIVF